ncbi:hypothetical protein F4778DRAFT_724143 [Xylariomycetidae sp. FL2044]|nr:hypothetical protein F4778DRAFT_724143 [Xylariomycetidae sp. FL2044]
MFKRLLSSRGHSKGGAERRVSEPNNFDLSRGRSHEFLIASPTTSSSAHGRSTSPSPSGLGLRVIHQPDFPLIDIIFVHGLGGHSQKTWSKDHDPSMFWPELWLPCEPDVGMARILTFGYNATWRGASKSISSITDFAKELLFEMRFAKNDDGADLDLGKRPIIFVVHSMGGLVVKKAYLLGIHDENYKDLIESISAIMFLSTPHRGTDLAKSLNRILAASFQSTKSFISDLNKSSPTIEELNEQFRHLAPRLSIWSFYETLATSIGPKKIMVLEKDTSVLGYPAEISRPLQADHHGVCKYSSPTDSTYISVRNAIKSLTVRFGSSGKESSDQPQIQSAPPENTKNIQEFFRTAPSSETDYTMLRRCWIPLTCDWFLRELQVKHWIEPSSQSTVLWYNAPPANGKSVLSAFMVSHLEELGLKCQFFMYKYSDTGKRSVAGSLLAVASQIAKEIPDFRRHLSQSSPESLGAKSGDASLIWRNIFEGILFELELPRPIYWVIDALDECESPKTLLDCLHALPAAKTSVKVLVLSRNSDSIARQFDRLSRSLPVIRIDKLKPGHNSKDIERFVASELAHMRGSDQFKGELCRTILARSEGNFLWTRLVLDEIMGCHTEESIQEVLEEVPADMTELYERMEKTLITSTRKSNQSLIQVLLEWCCCSQRPLSVLELSQALRSSFSGFLDLKRTIRDTCGQFIQVDDSGKVGILHHTAREYFIHTPGSKFHVQTKPTNERLLFKTLEVLRETDLQWKLLQSQHALQSSEPFVFYSAANWHYHLTQCNPTTSDCLDRLVGFFQSHAVLAWIHALAILRRMEILVKASKAVASYVHQMKKHNATRNPTLHRLSDLEVLSDWTVDLIKIVGKFGPNLTLEPGVIYDVIPSLCPPKSAIAQQFRESTSITVTGNPDSGWSDNLARLALPGEAQAWKVQSAGRYLAVLASTGSVHVWDSSNFKEVAKIWHGESVTGMTLNFTGGKLATYGFETTKLWSLPSGTLLSSVRNPRHARAMDMTFVDHDQRLLAGTNDNIIRYLDCRELSQGWQILHPNLLKETTRIDDAVVGSPMCMAFNGDRTFVAVSYRGAPLSVWRLSDGRCWNRCKRAKGSRNDQRRPSSNWFAVDRFTWNPLTNHILGIYKDGCVFKWHPMTDENMEVQKAADEIAASPNGKLFATSSSDGSVRVWDFAYFTVIYQLSSEDLVTELTFSPDSRRFYDLRGESVNVWESNSLTRFVEVDEEVTDANSEDQSSTAISKYSEEWTAHFEAVTASASAPDCLSYCAGYEDGTVTWFQRDKSQGLEVTRFHNFLPVVHLAWSPDSRFLAAADLAGDLHVKDMEKGALTVHVSLKDLENDDANIKDILFSCDSELLFVSKGQKASVYSIFDGKLQASIDLDKGHEQKWLCHPTQPNVIMKCGPLSILMFDWKTLRCLGTARYGHTEGQTPVGMQSETATLKSADTEYVSKKGSTINTTMVKVFPTQDKQFIFLLMNTPGGQTKSQHHLTIIPTTSLNNSGKDNVPSSLGWLNVPECVQRQMNIPLGVLPGSRLVFLDHDLWVCTCSLNNTGSQLAISDDFHRHFFIPRDWMGRSSLDNCELMEDGTLLWPKNECVILIECNLDDTRFASMFER